MSYGAGIYGDGSYGSGSESVVRPLTWHLNRLAGTLDANGVAQYAAAKAANVWAGTSAMSLTAAVAAKAGLTGQGYALTRLLNTLAGTTDMTAEAAASRIPT